MDHLYIDKVINRYYSYLPHGNDYGDTTDEFNYDKKENLKIKSFLIKKNILEPWGDYGKHILTDLGREIVEIHGGIEKYIAFNQNEINESKRVKGIEKQKLFNDATLAKWKKNTYWVTFGFALSAFILGIINFIDNRKTAIDKEKSKQTIQSMESELSTLHTLILNHEPLDSLNNSNVQNYSLKNEN